MSEERTGRGEPTRRDYLKYGTVLASGALAGCGGTGGSTPTDDGGTGPSPTTPGGDATDGTETATDTPTTEASYSATLAPVGEVTFREPPSEIFTVLSHHAGMAAALGRADDVNAVYAVDYSDSLMNAFTPRLDGVTIDWSDLTPSWNPSKETLYELDSDIHLADPAEVLTMGKWEQSDVTEVRDDIAPWFGNTFSDHHREPPAAYADSYEYYGLWEIFGRVATALRERPRYEALSAVRSDLLSTIEAGLPPESERPSAAMILPSTSDDSMWTYHLNTVGYHASHTRPLGAVDAVAENTDAGHGAQVDAETLLAADPDVLLILGGIVDYHDMPDIRARLADDPVASQVTAVQNGRVHAMATRHQGPLVNLFQLEMGAKQLYPEQFGAWPEYESGPYPELPADEQLFDHGRVADVIAGRF